MIGISANQADNGGVVFVPVATLQSVLGTPGAVNSYWITTTSRRPRADRPHDDARSRTRSRAHGHQVGTLVIYDAREQQVAANATHDDDDHGARAADRRDQHGRRSSTRSRWPCSSARARSACCAASAPAPATSARIFATEGLVVAVGGWLVGVPLGYVLARAIGWVAGEAVGLDIAFVFPLGYVAIALVGTVLLALLVMLAPLRRAVRFKPGEALRYA